MSFNRIRKYDVVIVGGGPAGLSAALILGRCCRSVLVCDSGKPRNARSSTLHGFLTREELSPLQFLSLARKELKGYPNIEIKNEEVTSIARQGQFFRVLTSTAEICSRKILLSTGVVDELPPLSGIQEFFGKSVFQCPYCDGYEYRGMAIGVYGRGERGVSLAKTLTGWTKDVILFTDGPGELNESQRSSLRRARIRLVEEPIECLAGVSGKLSDIVLKRGEKIPRAALFFNTPSLLRSKLLQSLGCSFSEKEGVYTDKHEKTEVSGIYAAGNILRDVQLSIVAAAEGARAAFGINGELLKEDLKKTG